MENVVSPLATLINEGVPPPLYGTLTILMPDGSANSSATRLVEVSSPALT